MGIVFGVTGTKEPTYTIISNAEGYQLRAYQSYFIAEVPSAQQNGDDFRTLAKYIGVFGTPENILQRPIDMTAPVLLDPNINKKLAMTSPVISGDKKMAFVLPFDFKDLAEIPKPTNERVKIKSIPEKLVAVKSFSGSYSDNIGEEQLQNLCKVSYYYL